MTFTEFVYLTVGACLTLAAQLVVQLVIIPRVEIRKRREDRWERHVQELGELVTSDLEKLAQVARRAQLTAIHITHEVRDKPDLVREGISKFVDDHHKTASEALETYRNLVDGRFTWLTDQIYNFNHRSPTLMQFMILWARYKFASLEVAMLHRKDPLPTLEEASAFWGAERGMAAEVRKFLARLARSQPPRGFGVWNRFTRWIRRVRSTLRALWTGGPVRKQRNGQSE